MKLLTKEEAQSIKVRPEGKSSYVKGLLTNMKPGDIILLEPQDWKPKYKKPSTYCLELGRKTGMGWKCATALDGSGWVIERIK